MTKQVAREDPKVKAWTGNVKSRDGFACQKCGSNKNLQAHHCVPYNVMPEMAYDINNGITLCKSCHAEFHSRYGTKRCGHYEVALFLGRVKEPTLFDKPVEPVKQKSSGEQVLFIKRDVYEHLNSLERAACRLMQERGQAIIEELPTPGAGEYIPPRAEITQEELNHIKDPIKKVLAQDYIRRGYWKLIPANTV